MIVYKKVHKGCQKGTAAEIILSAQPLSFGLSIKYTTEQSAALPCAPGC